MFYTSPEQIPPIVFSPLDHIVMACVLVLEGLLGLFFLWRSGVLKSRSTWLVSICLLSLAMIARAAFFDYQTLDYANFLSRWVDVFRQYGGFRALCLSVGNYNIPYLYFLAFFSVLPLHDLYLIKLLSTLSDVLLAWSVLLLCRHFLSLQGSSRVWRQRQRSALQRAVGKKSSKIDCVLLTSFFTVLFLPTVFLNSAVWGQCDSLYVAPLLLGIWCALEDRPWSAVILAAVAFGFKLQAVFILPIYFVFLMTGKLRWKHVAAAPVAYLLLVLPAVCFGRPFLETITLYFSQTGSIGSGLNYNSPSVFSLFTNIENKETAAFAAIILAFFYMLNLLAVSWVNRKHLSDRAILAMALLFAIGIPFLLPHMHERYFYGADILALVFAFSVPLYAATAILVQWASLLGYYAYLKMRYLLLMNHGATALIAAFGMTMVFFIKEINDHSHS